MSDAFYGLNFKVVSRGKGSCVVKAAAYQSGERLTNERTGETYDFTGYNAERDSVTLETAVMLPMDGDERLLDRSTFYNEIDKTHTAKNSQLARWGRVNIPREIPEGERMALVKSFVQREFVDRGMVADIALQEAPAGDGKPNPHAHILLAMRPLVEDGKTFPTRAAPGRPWNDLFTRGIRQHDNDNKLGFSNGKGEGDGFVRNTAGLVAFRELWAEHVNEWLATNDSTARCSHLSYKARGIEREPQPYIGKTKHVNDNQSHSMRDAVQAVNMQNRLACASRYNASGLAREEAEQIKRYAEARARGQGGSKRWNLADEWEIER